MTSGLIINKYRCFVVAGFADMIILAKSYWPCEDQRRAAEVEGTDFAFRLLLQVYLQVQGTAME